MGKIFEAILLGILQGLTEFLPVSSSGHLALTRAVIKAITGQEFDAPLTFDVAVHVATLGAVLVIFMPEVIRVLRGLPVLVTRKFWSAPAEVPEPAYLNGRLAFFVIIATFVTFVVAGPLYATGLLETFFQDPLIVGLMLVFTGSLLFATRSVPAEGRDLSLMNPGDAIVIGLTQGFAVIPGISRSGSTIAGGLLKGLDAKLAGRFSFLLAVPVIIAPGLLESRKLFEQGVSHVSFTLVGMVAAFLAGMLALRVLLWVLKKGRISGFAYYCWLVGPVFILLRLFGVVK